MPDDALQPIADESGFLSFISEFTSYERQWSFRYDAATLRLERMASFAAALGSPQERYPSVHVAGTKGKGTTCLITEALAARGSRRVGTYLSPHIENIRERVRVAGQSIPEAALCETLNAMLPELARRRCLGPDHFPTFFELMTALAMARFRDAGVDLGIFEVGLGGRLDATNILRPRQTAITSIGLEHTDKLGDTLALIAREKAGILKPGTPLVLGHLPDEAREVVLSIAAARGCPVREVAPDAVRRQADGRLAVRGFEGTFASGPVVGPGLRQDLAIAVELWRGILAESGATAEAADLAAALAALELPGRVELVPGDPPVVLDGAHTVDSMASLGTALEELGVPRPRRLVFAIASDKRLDEVIDKALEISTDVYLTLCDPQRSTPPEELAARCERRLRRSLPHDRVFARAEDAFLAARAAGEPVVVTGSIYLVGTLRRLARQRAAAAPTAGAARG